MITITFHKFENDLLIDEPSFFNLNKLTLPSLQKHSSQRVFDAL